ncbi:MAG: carbohydrate porin, partial [Gammaproteobacteria bacterium]|nr:carbohydrate porin [Gammaproteobacteria bacterium]
MRTFTVRAGPHRIAAALAACALLTGAIHHAHAQAEPAPPAGSSAVDGAPAAAAGSRLALYGQATYTEQETGGFRAPYSGPNSLSPAIGRETADATLYVGARLWRGAELWANPEADQGSGLDDTLGLAGFSSGEAYKVGRNAPYFRLQRAFIRQTINL